MSVRPSLSTLAFETTDLWPWYFAHVWIMTISRSGLKVKVIGHRSKVWVGLRLVRTVTWLVWPCLWVWRKSCIGGSSVSSYLSVLALFLRSLIVSPFYLANHNKLTQQLRNTEDTRQKHRLDDLWQTGLKQLIAQTDTMVCYLLWCGVTTRENRDDISCHSGVRYDTIRHEMLV